MMGIGSSPGAPRSSIMFLINMERSAILRSVRKSQYWCAVRARPERAGTGGREDIPVTISTLSLEISLTCCSPSEDMVVMVE